MGQKKSSGRHKKDQGNTQDGPKVRLFLLEEVLHQVGVVNCSVVLLKEPVITTQTRALSQEGCPLQHVHIASRHLTPLHNLKLHFPIEGKSTPDHGKHLQWDIPVMPVTLEAIRTVQVIFFSSGNSQKLSSTFQCPMFGAPLQIPNGQVCSVGWDVTFEDVFCTVSPSLADAVLWLLRCSQHQ